MNPQPIKTGIIGLGRSGWNLHALGLEAHPNFQIVAVSDVSQERRDEATARFGCQAYEGADALIADANVELVIAATPSHTHGPLSLQALAAGHHVLVEKPMATSVEEADEMVRAAQKAGKVLSVYQVRRTFADFLKIREIVESGVLGPIHLIKMCVYGYGRRRDWQTLRKFGGGTLNNTGAHFIDQALALAGGKWSDVFADMRHLVSAGDAEDHLKVVFRGADKTVVDVEISSVAAAMEKPPHWTILGKYGALTGSVSHLSWKYYDPQSVPILEAAESAASNREYDKAEDLPWIEESLDLGPDQSQKLFYDALYAAIREGAPAPASGAEIRDLIALFDECRAQNPEL